MYGARDELLARAGLAEDQHRAVGGGDEADLLEHGHESRALADDLVDVVDCADLLLEVLAHAHGFLRALLGSDVDRHHFSVK